MRSARCPVALNQRQTVASSQTREQSRIEFPIFSFDWFDFTCIAISTPILFSIEAVSEMVQPALIANPLTIIIEQSRQVLLFGVAPDLAGLAFYLLLSGLFSAVSLFIFQRLRPVFADPI